MKNIILILLTLFSVTLYSQQNILQEGGTKVNVTAITKAGTFKTTSTPKGLSTAGDSLMLHAATYNAPGGVSLSDQFLGNGKKTFVKEANGVTTALVVYNGMAADGDLGEGVGMDFLGGGETPMASLYATQNDVTGSTLTVNARSASGQTAMTIYNGESKTTTNVGFQIEPSITVSGILDATIDNNKSSSYIILSGAALMLPNPTTMPDGSYINYTVTNVTGSDAVINTTSGSSDFWFSGNSSASSDVTFSIGTVKTGKLVVQTVSGTKYWVVTTY